MQSAGQYIVVRKALFNFEPMGRGAFLSTPPRLGDTLYSGVDRMQWFDLDEAFYKGDLPEDLLKIRNSIKENIERISDIKTCRSLPQATKVLEFCNQEQPRNELIAIEYIDTDIASLSHHVF